MNYAGLPTNPYHALAKKICPKGAGSVFTFGLKGGYEAGVKLVSGVKLFSHLANIGDVRSLDHPPGLHHPSPAHRRAAQGRGRRPRRGAPLDRHRGRRRHHRRPGASAGLVTAPQRPPPPQADRRKARCPPCVQAVWCPRRCARCATSLPRLCLCAAYFFFRPWLAWRRACLPSAQPRTRSSSWSEPMGPP